MNVETEKVRVLNPGAFLEHLCQTVPIGSSNVIIDK